jgi:hypothetical protein
MVSPIQETGSGYELELDDEALKALADYELAELKMAERQQIEAAARNGERRLLDFGEVKMQVHPAFYWFWANRLGRDCWKDAQFVKEFLRDNPACRIRSRSETTTVVNAWGPDRNRAKFTKTYAETTKAA